MKKILLILSLGLSFFNYSQEATPNDALRYAFDDLNGTARFRALSGSMGAIGGDLSAININPAGAVVFKFNTFTASVSNFNKKNNSTYFGTKSSDNNSKLDLNQIGAVFVFDNTNTSSGWKKMSLAINYENKNNFNNNFLIRGTNRSNSISNYFLNAAQGIDVSNLATLPGESITSLYNFLGETPGLGFQAQQAMLGYQGFLFDLDGSGFDDSYESNVPSGGNYSQNFVNQTRGYEGKLTGNFATNYKDILSLGMNLNVHFTDFTRATTVTERNTNTSVTNTNVNFLRFDNDLYSYGRGFSFNMGAIANVTKEFRLGLAYESPTWYGINEELSQRLFTQSTDIDGSYADNIDPDVINIYPLYRVKTPSKWTGSAAYIFGNNGFINFDVSTRDYSNTRFRRQNEEINEFFITNLQNAITYNVGGEYKIKRVSLRAGYRYENSPFINNYNFGNLVGYSGGLGYSFSNSRLDLSYANTQRNFSESLITSGMNDLARINNINNSISLSYTVIF
jgi:hypothetical protein